MIKFHGTPLTPKDIFLKALTGKNSLVSFANPQDINLAFAYCDKAILDNGAFTTWQQLLKGQIRDIDWIKHWDKYYQWVQKHHNREFYFIPDVIDGTEEENDALLKDNPFNDGIPIWHVAESFDRLERLMRDYDYIAFGSSGEYSKLGTPEWHKRMNKAMKIVCNDDGFPKVKIHMLRCLDPKIFTLYPFYSGDSTNLARNHSRFKIKNGLFGDSNDGWKYLLDRIERYNSPSFYKFKNENKDIQQSLF